MSRKLMPGYRFATEAQWNVCLFTGADRDTRETRSSIRPFAPFAGPPTRFTSPGGWAPAISCASEIMWRDGQGRLERLPYADDKPLTATAPYAVAQATRLIATSTTLWAAGDGSLQGFDLDTLARQIIIETGGAAVLDIAADGHDGLFALLAQDNGWTIAQFDCAGQMKAGFALDEIADSAALVYLSRPDRLVVLTGQSTKLYWFAPGRRRPKFAMPVSAIRPCFGVTALTSDARARLFLGGTDGPSFGGLSHVLTLDAEGNPLCDFIIDEAPTGIAANRTQLLVTGDSGLQRFTAGASVPRESSETRTTIMTPMLQSPSTSAVRRWLRAEATVQLPPGSTIEFSFAATDDRDVHDEAARILANPELSTSRRLQGLRTVLGPWRTISFHGDETALADATVPLSAPLFDIHEQFLWVSIALIASPGAGIPVLSELAVLYPGETLMENLPSIYQRVESQPGSFLRALVGVLESTTQTLDARISELGRLIDPRTAPDTWLDYIAQWLGLPWDDALSLEQKRNIATHAADIAAGRGTRAGLEALLGSLMPGNPPRFRIVDSTADYGLSLVGGDTCAGATLPTILGGLPTTATELGMKAILGEARLPCLDSESDPARLVGRIRIDVAADAHEQAQWQPWLRTLIDDMVPATARAQLRWLSAAAFRQGMRLDDSLRLEDDPVPHLGTDAVTGLARLPERRGISLPGSGADYGTSLH